MRKAFSPNNDQEILSRLIILEVTLPFWRSHLEAYSTTQTPMTHGSQTPGPHGTGHGGVLATPLPLASPDLEQGLGPARLVCLQEGGLSADSGPDWGRCLPSSP